MRKIYKPEKERVYSVCETVQAITAVIIGAVLICIVAYLIKTPMKAKAKEEPTTATYYEEITEEDKSDYERYIDRVPLEPEIIKYIVTKSQEKGIDPALVFAVIEVESSFNKEAKNGPCIGLMQVNCNNFERPNQAMASLISPSLNIDAGIEILSGHLKKYPLEKALTCYNMGERGAKGRDTSSYAKKVLHAKERYE